MKFCTFGCRIAIALLATVVSPQYAFTETSRNTLEEVILGQGYLEPATAMTRAKGMITLVREADGGEVVRFAEDYAMSSGVVLDLKLCGVVAEGTDQIVCVSQAEVRKLRGEYELSIRFPLERYTELKIFDVDLIQDHARAKLQ